MAGHHVGWIRLAFTIPNRFRALFEEGVEAQSHPESNHLLYSSRRVETVMLQAPCCIRRSIHIFPKFGRVAPQEWPVMYWIFALHFSSIALQIGYHIVNNQ